VSSAVADEVRGFAVTGDQRIFVALAKANRARGLYELRRVDGKPVATLTPVLGTVNSQDADNEAPRGVFYRLWGADGNELVVQRNGDWPSLVWVKVRNPRQLSMSLQTGKVPAPKSTSVPRGFSAISSQSGLEMTVCVPETPVPWTSITEMKDTSIILRWRREHESISYSRPREDFSWPPPRPCFCARCQFTRRNNRLRVSGVLTVTPAQAQASPTASSEIEPTAAAIPSRIAPKDDRLFFVLPNYLTVENRDQFEPLAAKTKFKLSAKTMSDPITISFIGMITLMGQARNSNPSYGQGFSGYAKRYGTFYADTGIGTLMTTSVLPTLLHQDPRYFQLGSGGIWHRAMYSVSRIFVARTDNGDLQFNSSEIVGNAVAAGISNIYHSQNQRTLGNTLSIWGTDIMLNAVCNVAKEFWPDLRHKLHKSKSD